MSVFAKPSLGHRSYHNPAAYKAISKTLSKFSNEPLAFDGTEYPSGSKKIYSANSGSKKKNLIISVVEDDPKVLANILKNLDRIIRLGAEFDPALKNRDLYLVWATNATNHEKEFDSVSSKLKKPLDSLAILDGNLSSVNSQETRNQESGHQVLDFLLQKKKTGKIVNQITQFQSSGPDWVIQEAYDYEKTKSGFMKAIPEELRPAYSDLEDLHINPGYGGSYGLIRMFNEDSGNLMHPSSMKKPQLTEKLTYVFRKQDDWDLEYYNKFTNRENPVNWHGSEQLHAALGRISPIFDPKNILKHMKDSDGNCPYTTEHELRQLQQRGCISQDISRNAFEQLHDRYKPISKWLADNANEYMNIFDNDRHTLVTYKLAGNIGNWMKSLLKAALTNFDNPE